jgi:hypothetical protein
MKLQKALKEKAKLIGEISKLKQKIQTKNSFVSTNNTNKDFDTVEMSILLIHKIGELIELKVKINEANLQIQEKMYRLGEYKSMIAFLQNLNVNEGTILNRYDPSTPNVLYVAQITEKKRDASIAELQKDIDTLQEEIDTYNYTTEIDYTVVK